MRQRLHSLLLLLATLWLLTGCRIEPPLHLGPDPEDVQMNLPIVITDLDVVWDVEADWRSEWYYGWDETDERLWGKLEYPMPTNYEVRRFFTGQEPGSDFVSHDGFTIYTNSFRRKYAYGYHNLLLWSNIDSPDGTQTVIIDESNLKNICATTSKTQIGYSTQKQRTRTVSTHNQPEIFYASQIKGVHITDNPADYDYFDPEEQVWVKRIHTDLVPMVYIYLVQVILHNNNGRIVNVADRSALDGLADGVSLHTGETSQVDANITFDMRLKNGIDVKGELCDIAGGKLTTYGLCGMPPWTRPGRAETRVTRVDLENTLSVCLLTRKGNEVIVTKDMTETIRQRPHGGVLTVHINIDDLDLPDDRPASSGFNPTVEEYGYEEYEFKI